MYYDPMISKLICRGESRSEALANLNKAIDEFVIKGVIHNLGFWKAIINNESFIEGDYSTAFIGKYFKEGFHGVTLSNYDNKLLSLVAFQIFNILNAQKQIKGIQYQKWEFPKLYFILNGKTFWVEKKEDKFAIDCVS